MGADKMYNINLRVSYAFKFDTLVVKYVFDIFLKKTYYS